MKKPKNISQVMGYLGSIKTEKKSAASRKNAKLGAEARRKIKQNSPLLSQNDDA